MYTILSIGLNVGPREPADQHRRTLADVNRTATEARAEVTHVAVGSSAWEGVPERFVQVRLDRYVGQDAIGALAHRLGQECIAVLYGDGAADHEDQWALVDPRGLCAPGAPLGEFPPLVPLGHSLAAA